MCGRLHLAEIKLRLQHRLHRSKHEQACSRVSNLPSPHSLQVSRRWHSSEWADLAEDHVAVKTRGKHHSIDQFCRRDDHRQSVGATHLVQFSSAATWSTASSSSITTHSLRRRTRCRPTRYRSTLRQGAEQSHQQVRPSHWRLNLRSDAAGELAECQAFHSTTQ